MDTNESLNNEEALLVQMLGTISERWVVAVTNNCKTTRDLFGEFIRDISHALDGIDQVRAVTKELGKVDTPKEVE